jgi:fructose-1,6-bisphosphatase/inositol monophosphatase family enzyme
MFREEENKGYALVREQVRYPVFGKDCYAYGLLASGYLDIVMESTMKLYDYAALVPVIEGAGGKCTDWAGAPLGIASSGQVLAAGDAELHRLLCTMLSAYAE